MTARSAFSVTKRRLLMIGAFTLSGFVAPVGFAEDFGNDLGNVQLAFAVEPDSSNGQVATVANRTRVNAVVQDPVPMHESPVIGAPELDLSTVQLAPGESLVIPGVPMSPNYSAAAQGYAPPQPVHRSTSRYGMPCPTCPDRRYVLAEALYVKRDSDDFFTFSDRFFLPEFDFELGMRITTGYIADCMDGVEFSYTGLLNWKTQASDTGTLADPLNLLAPLAPNIAPANFNTFYNAEAQSQSFRARYHSFEANQRNWGWDVISVLHGLRVISYDETFDLGSRNFAGQTGAMRIDTDNLLIGLQMGIDMLYPTGPGCSVGFRGRAGGYANFARGQTQAVNNGTRILNLSPDDQQLSGMFEAGVFGTRQLTKCCSIRAGYEVWYLAQVATVASNLPTTITTSFGRNLDTADDIFFHGLTTGIEFRW